MTPSPPRLRPEPVHIAPPPPPPSALPILAKAQIILHSRTDLATEAEFGAVAACGIMLYGVFAWRQAERRTRLHLIDEEEGRIAEDSWVDLGLGGCRSEVSQREHEGGVEANGADHGSEGDVQALVEKAVGEIRAWDREMGVRVEFVLRELVWSNRGD